MQIIPFKTEPGRYNLFVILEDANVERIKQYDPAQFDARKLPEEWHACTLDVIIIGYANAHDIAKVRELIGRGAAASAMEYLSRGFAYKPLQGDNDFPYTRPQ